MNRRQFLKRCGRLAAFAAGAGAWNGCGLDRRAERPIALAVAIDASGSALYALPSFVADIRPTLCHQVALAQPLALLRMGDITDKHPLKFGQHQPARMSDVDSAVKELIRPFPANGTDLMPGLEAARAFLEPENLNAYRRIVLIWSDLIADPHKQDGTVQTFQDPLQHMAWNGLKVDLYCYGLPAGRIAAVKTAWKNQVKSIQAFEAGVTFTPQHLGLQIHAGL
jgi:hypothetical protein